MIPLPTKRQKKQKRAKLKAEKIAVLGHVCIPAQKGAPGKCWGRIELHHVKPAGQGGKDTHDDTVLSCEFHNQWMEDHPAEAALLGIQIMRKEPRKIPQFIAPSPLMALAKEGV